MRKKSMPYRTMSRFGRLNLDNQLKSPVADTIEEILTDIKSLNTRAKPTTSQPLPLSHRLLMTTDPVKKMRSRYNPKKKALKKIPIVRQFRRLNKAATELPGAAHYKPNYSALLPHAPQYKFSNADTEKRKAAQDFTMNEMMEMWQGGVRDIVFDKDSAPYMVSDVSNTSRSENDKSRVLGLIGRSSNRESYCYQDDMPGPGQYTIARTLDKPRNIPFEAQETRKEIETLTDRTHVKLAHNIDNTLPKSKTTVPFDKQLARDNEKTRDDSIWEEIKEEQEALVKLLKPEKKTITEKKTQKQPFSLQTSHFEKHPFQHMMRTSAPSGLLYETDDFSESKKIPSGPNFGRRLDDNDRAIYVQTEAPDVIYPNVVEQWKKTKKSDGAPPNLASMNERKSAYDYMPKTCGGKYTYVVKDNWSYRTSVVMDNMGKRKILLSVPPQYSQKRSSSSQMTVFTK